MDSSLCHHRYFLDKPLRFAREVLKGQPVLSGHLVIPQLSEVSAKYSFDYKTECHIQNTEV